MVRVLFLNSCINGGGAGRSLEAFLANVPGEIEAHVVMPEPGVIAKRLKNVKEFWYVPEFVERIQRSPYRFAQRLGNPILHIVSGGIAILHSMFKITSIAKKVRPDVIYCNHMLAKPVGAFVGGLLRIPVVFHVRNVHVHWFGRWF